MAKYIRRKYRSRVRKYRPVKAAVRRAVVKAKAKVFNKKVLRVIHQQAENKISRVTNYGGSASGMLSVPDAPRTTGADCFPIIPSISETATAGTFYRSGQKIKARSLVVKGYYAYTPNVTVSTENFNHIGIRIMVVSPKNVRDQTSIVSNSGSWIQNLLQNGSTTQQFSNSVPSSLYLPFNGENIIKYYDKVHYLHNDYMLQTTASGITPLPTNMLFKHFTIRIPMKNKTLMYDQSINSGLTPTNFNPVLMVGAVQMNGYANTATLGKFFYTSELQWEDL